jgi:SulP family sulfate permease
MTTAPEAEAPPRAIERWLPGLALVRHYQKGWLRTDLLAGVTVCALLIPQGMAYGELAGVEPVAGLYAALGAMLLYALVSRTRVVMVGPEAGVAIIVAASLTPLAGGDPVRYVALAGTLALLVAGVLFVGGLVRVGFIVDFVSKPVLSGYIIGAAFIIISSQLGKLFGISLEEEDFFPKVWELITNLDQTHRLTFVLGLVFIALLLLLRRLVPKAPNALIVLVLAIVVSVVFDLDEHGVAVLGEIPAGLPSLTVPEIGLGDVQLLFPASLGIALLAFTEGILTARVFAEKRGETLDADQELLALGAANLGAAFTQGFPIGVSQSRTVVDDDMGGKSQMVGIVAAAIVALFLLFFTPLLEPLPSVALGAIVVVASLGLIEIGPLRVLRRVDRREFGIAIVALAGVLALGILEGILVAVLLSLLMLLARISRPHDAVLAHDEGVDGFHAVEGAAAVQAAPGLIVYRFDAPLFFANAPRFLARVEQLAATADPPLQRIVIDVEPIVSIDTTAAEMLLKLHDELAGRGITLAVARADASFRDMLQRTGATDTIGPENFYPSVRTAVQVNLDGRAGPITAAKGDS